MSRLAPTGGSLWELASAYSLIAAQLSATYAPLEDSPAPPFTAAPDGWMGEVSARIRDASHVFSAVDDCFVAEAPAVGLRGRLAKTDEEREVSARARQVFTEEHLGRWVPAFPPKPT